MKKDLLKENRHALQFLHAVEGFDFQQPHTITKGAGRFTASSVDKEIKKALGLRPAHVAPLYGLFRKV